MMERNLEMAPFHWYWCEVSVEVWCACSCFDTIKQGGKENAKRNEKENGAVMR